MTQRSGKVHNDEEIRKMAELNEHVCLLVLYAKRIELADR